MFDWTKEKAAAGKNYCGWCIGSPPSANCDGSCFKENFENFQKNRLDHLDTERTVMQERLKEIGNEIKKILNG